MAANLEKAIELATFAHDGQFRMNGEPYINHPLRVMELTRIFGYSILTQCVAVLHDAPEDVFENKGIETGEMFEIIRKAGFTDEVLIPLGILTKDPGEIDTAEKYMDIYIKQRIAPNPRSRAVKKCDLLDNLDYNNLLHPTDKQKRKEQQYLDAFNYLVLMPQPRV